MQPTAIDAIVERYLVRLQQLLPPSPSYDAPISCSHDTGARLARMMELPASPFSNCTDRQAKVLCYAVGGRTFLPQYTNVGSTTVQTDGVAKAWQMNDVAYHANVSIRTCYRELKDARRAVQRAYFG